MSAKNGHIARFHRVRKKKLARRLITRALRAELTQAATATAAASVETPA